MDGQSMPTSEIEATEACKWLRATGFPQYGQMFEDGLFPISIESVRKDHDFLDADSFQTLCRRLNTLNRCAQLRVDTSNRKAPEDSDEEDEHCALSDKWQYLHSSRRWSRLGLDVDPSHDDLSPVKCSTSHDSLLADQETFSLSGDSPVLDASPRLLKSECLPESLDHSYHSEKKQATSNLSFISPRLRRAASERFNSARNILRRADTKGKYKKSGMDYLQISNPVVLDKENMKEKIRHLNCVDLGADVQASQKTVQNAHLVPLCMTKSLPDPWLDNEAQSSPQNASSLLLFGDSSSACFSTPPSHISDDSDTLVDSTLQRNNLSPQHRSENNLTEVYFLPADHKPGSFPKVICNGYIETGEGHGINYRTGSFSLGRDTSRMGKQEKQVPQNETQEKVKQNRTSMYDNVPDDEDLKSAQHELDIILHELFQNIHGLSQALGEDPIYPGNDGTCLNSEGGNDLDHSREDDVQDAPSVESSQENSDQEQEDHDDHVGGRERRDSGVGSSLTRVPSVKKRTRIRWHSFQKCHRPSFNSQTAQICSLSAGQLMVLHKLCLLKLTGLIEKYSPANRSGWNWGVPRFIKRQKEPDYRNRNVFGVPLLVTLRRTGQPLPQCILYAMRYLRRTAKHAVGIFRKSGVRSRIQRLRDEIEANPELVDFKEMQAYDVADLVKQYFRELPECLLTNKLSETFINIFTHVPADCRLEAVQSAIILMPDENREVLQSLLLFLSDISQHASEHQMTASNLAVCFAPSLFNIGNIGKMGHSPRRSRKNLGVPDPKELLDQKAAHECLMFMIRECKRLFTIPLDTFTKCRFSYMEQGDPVSLDEFNKKEDNKPDFESWVDSCIQGLLKESREKFRCWISVATTNGIDVAYKKVGDGHPLRLWMCSAEVEAPPVEVLNRIMIERHQWDEDLLSWGIVEKLDHQTDVFQFVRNSMAPHPSRDICMLRSWRTNLPKGACVLVSTSIEHPSAKLVGGVRGVVLASRYLIEYCDSGKSRVTHISRVDTRGRSAEWYNKAYGHICANFMRHIQNSFRQKTDGPETKV